jgi:hypothetical protein
MPGRSPNSPLGRALGVAAAGLAVVLLALNRWSGLNVSYGYGSGGDVSFLVGAIVAVVAVALGGYRLLSRE